MQDLNSGRIEQLLEALGDHLASAGVSVAIVVVGGAALNIRNWIERTTHDVDVIAVAETALGERRLVPPDHLPQQLIDGISRIARDFGLPDNWMNTEVADQWKTGLPNSISDSIEWRKYGLLEVGLVGRDTLISLKLFAAVDGDRESVHYQDLLALKPDASELAKAADWVKTQDAGACFGEFVDEVVKNVRTDPGRNR